MKKRFFAMLLGITMTSSLLVGCSTNTEGEVTEVEVVEEAVVASNILEVDNSIEVEKASVDEVISFINDTDENTILVDARSQEAYSGWELEGATNGGYLKTAKLFSARWLDCDYSGAAPRQAYVERALESQNITADKNIIVYDYSGNQGLTVARYLIGNGMENVKYFQADELINDGNYLESYENHDMFLPTEIVKSVSDVKTGKTETLSDDAKALFGDDLSNVLLVDVGWGNAKMSSYFSAGHVPGAVHINSDSYERPRVYVPEKRSDYAKEWRLISLEEFRDDVCPQYGITKDSVVILTGTTTAPQGRLGFMLRSLGVKVYVMSGNLSAWSYNGYELDKDESTLVIPTAVDSFGSNVIANPDEILWTEDIKAILNGEVKGQVADNRLEAEWLGTSTGYGYHDLAGYIEGTIWCLQENDTSGDFFNNVDGTPRTKGELKAYMESNGLDTNETIAFFCGDSWGAAKIAYWCQAVDLNNVKQWGQGWIPWSNEGNEFIDHNGNKVSYDKYLDAVVDENGNVVSDGVNILAE